MEQKTLVAMVAVNDDALPDQDAISKALAVAAPAETAPLRVSQTGNVRTFALGEATLALTFFPGPIPWTHLEGPCACAWYWPTATETLRSHRCHIMIVLLDQTKDPVQRFARLTHIVAAVAQASQAVGVFWGTGGVVHPPEAFLELATGLSDELLPLYLWIDFRVERIASDQWRLFTTGMQSFGLQEIEVCRYSGTAEAVREAVYNVAHYAILESKPLGDGDTLAIGPMQSVTVRHAPSMLDPSIEVVQLEF